MTNIAHQTGGNNSFEVKSLHDLPETSEVKTFKEKSIKASSLILRNIENIPCLVEPIFQKVGLVSLAGSSDVGKSTLLRQLAIAISSRESNFLDFRINATYNKAVYVSSEDDEFAISYLLNKFNRSQGLTPEMFENLRFIFDTQNIIESLNEELTKEPVDLVIIDAFTDLYSGQLNEANRVRSFLNEFSQLAQKYECLVIILHHTGKRTDTEPPSKHNLIGSQAFEAKMRCVIELRQDVIDASKRHLCIVKGNYLPAQFKNESFVLDFDQDMIFRPTGERTHFSELVKPNGDKEDIRERVNNLKSSGYTQKQISEMLGISQPTISRILNE